MLVCRSYFYYKPHPRDDRAERKRITEIAETRVRYGMWRIHTLMRREGWLINHKKTRRIYVEEGLSLRRKRPRRRVAAYTEWADREPPGSMSVGAWISCPTSSSTVAAFGP